MMRHLGVGLAGVAAAMLAAPSANAQLLPVTPLKTTVGEVLEATKSTSKKLVTAPQPLVKSVTGLVPKVTTQVTNVVGKTVGTVTTVTSPLLRTVVGPPPVTLSSTSAPPPASPSQPATATVQIAPTRSSAPRLAALAAPPIAAPLAAATALADARVVRLRNLIGSSSQRLDTDDLGRPIVRGELLLVDADAGALERLRRGGFRILADVADAELGFRRTTLATPMGQSATDALRQVRALAPAAGADFDHVYEPAGGALHRGGKLARATGHRHGLTVGMIDGGVAAHPALAGRVVEQHGFAGAATATGHGTSVASLLVGEQGRFRGAATGASLLVADVYGHGREAGSASAIASALSWLSSKRPRVINVSLVGPPNQVVRRAIAAVQRKGIPVVAAVGNDGPASPPQYPASYPGVVSVTGVDDRGVALFESGNASHVDFAAPGADMAAARPGGGYHAVRGTSFAAPLVAGRLAEVGSLKKLAAEARPGKGRVGHGIVCGGCRVAPDLLAGR